MGWIVTSALWVVAIAFRWHGRRDDLARNRRAIVDADKERASRLSQGAKAIRARLPGGPGEWVALGTYEVSRSDVPAEMPWITLGEGIAFDLDGGGRLELVDGGQFQALVPGGRSIRLGLVGDGTQFRYELPSGLEVHVLGVAPPVEVVETSAYRTPGAVRIRLEPVGPPEPWWPAAYCASDDPSRLEIQTPSAFRFSPPWVLMVGVVAGVAITAVTPTAAAIAINLVLAPLAWFQQWDRDVVVVASREGA